MYFAALLPELLRKNPVSFFYRHPVDEGNIGEENRNQGILSGSIAHF